MVNVSNRGSIANFLRKLFSHLINKICNEFREFQRLNMAFKKLDHKIFSQEIICEIYENEFDLILKSWQSPRKNSIDVPYIAYCICHIWHIVCAIYGIF